MWLTPSIFVMPARVHPVARGRTCAARAGMLMASHAVFVGSRKVGVVVAIVGVARLVSLNCSVTSVRCLLIMRRLSCVGCAPRRQPCGAQVVIHRRLSSGACATFARRSTAELHAQYAKLQWGRIRWFSDVRILIVGLMLFFSVMPASFRPVTTGRTCVVRAGMLSAGHVVFVGS